MIRTDAEGIGFIFKKESAQDKRAVSRADGWALRISAYDFEIECIPGNKNIADVLSRLYEGLDGPYIEKEVSGEICVVDDSDLADVEFEEGSLTAGEIKIETEKDFELQEVYTAVEEDNWDAVNNPEISPLFRKVREQLGTRQGIITKQGAVVLPKTLRARALTIAHEGHPGMTAMKSILRARVWWPGMKEDIEEKVRSCEPCLLTARQDKPVPMLRSRLPEGPWQDLAVDFSGPHAKFGGVYIFVIVDYYSRYLSLSILRATDFESVMKAYEDLFQRYGYPGSIKSDNGPPFNGKPYKDYCTARGILARFSTPLFPQQNGMAERYMQVVNKAMCIAVSEGTDYRTELSKAVRAHNSAENRTTGRVPEELMFARKIRRHLPLVTETQVTVNREELRERDERQKAIGKEREDRKRKARTTEICQGDLVVVLNTTRAKDEPRFDKTKYVVVEIERGDLTLVSDDGKITKRNVTHVKKVSRQQREYREELEDEMSSREQVEEPSVQAHSSRRSDTSQPRTSERQRSAPKYLKDYVRRVEEE